MKNKSIIYSAITLGLFTLFIFFTLAVSLVDVEAIGPLGSSVGLSTINALFRDAIGESTVFYTLSEVTIYIAILIAVAFFVLGVIELIQRKSLLKVDRHILMLAIVYAVTVFCYIIFEIFVVNYRPVTPEGVLEASYPSTHTMLVLTILMTAIPVFNTLIKSRGLKLGFTAFASVFSAFTVITRMLSGVHWLTDIVAGVLLSAFLIMLYHTLISLTDIEKKEEK